MKFFVELDKINNKIVGFKYRTFNLAKGACSKILGEAVMSDFDVKRHCV
jgi:hypothetical protein